MVKLNAAFWAIALLCLPAQATQVISVSDGDTLTVLQDRKQVKVRLADIDAPDMPKFSKNGQGNESTNICTSCDLI